VDAARLTAIPVFSELSPEEARRLSAFATETSAAAGEVLMRQGDFSTELIAIEEGAADVIATAPMRLLKLTHWEIRRMSEETVERIRSLVLARSGATSES
jgi:hypothetical protein